MHMHQSSDIISEQERRSSAQPEWCKQYCTDCTPRDIFLQTRYIFPEIYCILFVFNRLNNKHNFIPVEPKILLAHKYCMILQIVLRNFIGYMSILTQCVRSREMKGIFALQLCTVPDILYPTD
jgi:hypothetical protein